FTKKKKTKKKPLQLQPIHLNQKQKQKIINMKFLMIVFAICSSLALVAGQLLFGQLSNRQINFNSIDYPQPAQEKEKYFFGPVVFPPSPPDAIDESSGVIVGASGYGFVPPQQNFSFKLKNKKKNKIKQKQISNTLITAIY
ncbi:hypothetical protein DOY81_001321, partial [Sarcophaga bullata]